MTLDAETERILNFLFDRLPLRDIDGSHRALDFIRHKLEAAQPQGGVDAGKVREAISILSATYAPKDSMRDKAISLLEQALAAGKETKP